MHDNISPEHRAIMEQTIGENGLAWRPMRCTACGYHLGDDAILIGMFRKKCPNCKYPNVIQVNRIGEQELADMLAWKQERAKLSADKHRAELHQRLVDKTNEGKE